MIKWVYMSDRYYLLGETIAFDTLKREITVNENIYNLGGRESDLLKLLCENQNQVLKKQDIHMKVWGSIYVSDTSLTKAISNLRKQLRVINGLDCSIKTVPKEGYVLISDNLLMTKSSASVQHEKTEFFEDLPEKISENFHFEFESKGNKIKNLFGDSVFYILFTSVFSSSIIFIVNYTLGWHYL
ncbi:TPA: transcriptional regulator [Vibrio metschnikovii]